MNILFKLKEEIRKRVLEARFRLSPEERTAKSRKIEERLFSLPAYRDAATVMFFASFRSEVDTHGMIRRALTEGKRVVLPRVKGKSLALFAIKDFDQDVAPGAWDIPEPYYGTPVDIAAVDFVVMPGVAFDERGNRLGHGAGFYDKTLSSYRGRTAGLAYEVQIIPEVPVSEHDVPVNQIVTEKRVIETSSNNQAPSSK